VGSVQVPVQVTGAPPSGSAGELTVQPVPSADVQLPVQVPLQLPFEKVPPQPAPKH
jgi:hypothetical protein